MDKSSGVNHETSSVKKTWVLVLIMGLALEVCVLAVLVGVWALGRDLGANAARLTDRVISPSSVLATKTISPIETTPLDSNQSPTSDVPVDTETAVVTATPELPQFDEPPPGRVVYTCFDGRYDQICIMNADGSNKRQLTYENTTNFYPSLSPDGDQIVFSSKRDGNFEIFMMDVEGGNPVKLTEDIGNLYAPEISPKYNRIIFTVETGGLQSIWIMKIDGSNARPLVESSGSDVDPTWAPDASQIAYTSLRSNQPGVYIANADGTNPRRVTPHGISVGGRSSWSPFGFWIAFYAGVKGDRNIYTIGTDGRNLNQITNGGDNLAPSYSPDGQWLAFTSFRDGNNEIYIVQLDGSQEHRLTFNPLSDWQPRWGP
jgi:tol-pal system beta propeller repeat protein TolB